jgi:hypothetical protein
VLTTAAKKNGLTVAAEAKRTMSGVFELAVCVPGSTRDGAGVFAALEADAGCGLLDRLIADDYRRAELTTLTLDREMAALPQARRL